MMSKNIFIALLALTVSTAAYSQAGSVRIEQPPLIAELLLKHITYNEANPGMNGYRIRIYRDNSGGARQRSEGVATAFTEAFPDVPAYRGYDNPYFKVSVGDFRSKDDAIKVFARIKRSYPNAYLVPERINLPPL